MATEWYTTEVCRKTKLAEAAIFGSMLITLFDSGAILDVMTLELWQQLNLYSNKSIRRSQTTVDRKVSCVEWSDQSSEQFCISYDGDVMSCRYVSIGLDLRVTVNIGDGRLAGFRPKYCNIQISTGNHSHLVSDKWFIETKCVDWRVYFWRWGCLWQQFNQSSSSDKSYGELVLSPSEDKSLQEKSPIKKEFEDAALSHFHGSQNGWNKNTTTMNVSLISQRLQDLTQLRVPYRPEFKLLDYRPIIIASRKTQAVYDKIMQLVVTDTLKTRIIKHAQRPWTFPAVIARKSNGKPMFCISHCTQKENESQQIPNHKVKRLLKTWMVRAFLANLKCLQDNCRFRWLSAFKKWIHPTECMNILTSGNTISKDDRTRDFPEKKNPKCLGTFQLWGFTSTMSWYTKDQWTNIYMNHIDKICSRIPTIGLKLQKYWLAFTKLNDFFHVIFQHGVILDPEKQVRVSETRIRQLKNRLQWYGLFFSFYQKFARGFAASYVLRYKLMTKYVNLCEAKRQSQLSRFWKRKHIVPLFFLSPE